MTTVSIHSLRRLLLGIAILLVSITETRTQLDPDREEHIHMEYVQKCMKPILAQCQEPTAGYNASDLNFRPAPNAEVVEIAPQDAPDFVGIALDESERQLLFDLATCIAYVGLTDPFAEEDDPPEYDWTLTEEIIEKVWSSSFDVEDPEEESNSHTEERQFDGKGQGGNRVVFMQEFLQLILPDLYWKIREIASQAVIAGKAAGLFQHENALPVSHLGLRVVEYLTYNSGGSYESHLGWHGDGESIYTMVIMLGDPLKDFKGGSFKIRGFRGTYDRDRNKWVKDEVELNPSQGSGVLFDSETMHGISSLVEGKRRVIVFEFWEKGDNDIWSQRPGLEDVEEQPELEIVPEGCVLEDGLYQRACWQ